MNQWQISKKKLTSPLKTLNVVENEGEATEEKTGFNAWDKVQQYLEDGTVLALKVGQEVNVKVLKVENGKISLSMKALEEVAPEEEDTSGEEVVSYKDEGDATTGLGALLAGLKL